MINIFDAKHRKLNAAKILARCLALIVYTIAGWSVAQESAPGPIKVFLLAGDENVLEQGVIGGDTKGKQDDGADKPGTLTKVVAENPKYAFLKDKDGNWVTRDDVVLYDAHAIHNNTEAPARPLKVGVMGLGGPDRTRVMGPDLMHGHVLGKAYEEPVMIIRFGTRHPTWFRRGSRGLAHDYRPPSSDGGSDLDGNWDVIHFNFGVWDATYDEPSSPYFSGHRTTSVEDFEKNLRTVVAKMKKTGATLIWATVTPVWEGEPSKPNGDEDAYNRVAEKVMGEELQRAYPGYAGQDVDLAGLIWFQGIADGKWNSKAAAYEKISPISFVT